MHLSDRLRVEEVLRNHWFELVYFIRDIIKVENYLSLVQTRIRKAIAIYNLYIKSLERSKVTRRKSDLYLPCFVRLVHGSPSVRRPLLILLPPLSSSVVGIVLLVLLKIK